MRLKFKNIYIIGIIIAALIIIMDFYLFFGMRWFWPLIIIAGTIGWSQFWIDFLLENKRQKRIEEKFLDFARNLESNVKSGIPIPQSIIQSGKEDYSELNPYIKKLGNQISLGIPIHQSLINFSEDTRNKTIKRAVTIIIEAEESGGDIEQVLKSVTDSIVSEKKMKEERASSMFSQVIQGYIVFMVFIGIMLLLQLKLFPKLAEMGSSMSGAGMALVGGAQLGAGAGGLENVFFTLIMIQGLFAGLMIGEFTGGTIKQGLIHSVIMMTLGALIMTTAGVI